LAQAESRYAGPTRLLAIVALVFALVMAFLRHPPPLPGNPNDKLVHATTFVVLSALFAAGWPRWGFWRILLLLSAIGAMIEVVQGTRLIGRDASAYDWLADTVATLAMLAVVMLVRRRRLRRAD
jgi:VanZ family protein